jgi:hypothetical protein
MAKRPFVVDPVLTAIAIGYTNPADTLIADEVLPRAQVGQETFKWTKYPLEDGFSIDETLVGRKGKPNEVEFSGDEAESSVQDHGLDAPVVNSDVDAARAAREKGLSTYDPEARAVAGLTNRIQLAREVRVASLIQNLNTYAASRRVTLAGTSQLSDFNNSDPIATISAAIDGTLVFRPNTVVMGSGVWSVLRRHPVLVNAIRGNLTDKGLITREEFQELFEIKKLLVGSSFVNTAKKGQAATLARCWGKNIACLYINPEATTQEGITFGLTAQFGTRIAGRIEDPDIGLQGGYRVRSGERIKELVVAPDVGFFIQNAVA